jgi:hypothetical protein
MTAKSRLQIAALMLTLGLASQARAFSPLPPFQCPWFEDKDCPKGSYCCLHYVTPSLFSCRAYHTPPRYVYGCPVDLTFVGYRIDKYPCLITSPAEQASKYIETGRRKGSVPETLPAPTSEAAAGQKP